jgi:hypothetical protein
LLAQNAFLRDNSFMEPLAYLALAAGAALVLYYWLFRDRR